MSILSSWVNPYYLEPSTIENIKESIKAKPDIKYAVLDNFFNLDKIDELIEHHSALQFDEAMDRRSGIPGKLLPYDGAVVFAKPGEHFGSDLFFDSDWHRYCCDISGVRLPIPAPTDVKLRYHKPNAEGFWIHTDSIARSLVIICYFNKDWKASDGGLLQLWRIDEADDPYSFTIENPEGRMDFLNHHKRIRTSTPGGGFPDGKPHDLVLIDQVVPAFNRVFICNFQNSLAYHSVTPSNGKVRLGFVQWLLEPNG